MLGGGGLWAVFKGKGQAAAGVWGACRAVGRILVKRAGNPGFLHRLGIAVHACNPSTPEVVAGGPGGQGQHGLWEVEVTPDAVSKQSKTRCKSCDLALFSTQAWYRVY